MLHSYSILVSRSGSEAAMMKNIIFTSVYKGSKIQTRAPAVNSPVDSTGVPKSITFVRLYVCCKVKIIHLLCLLILTPCWLMPHHDNEMSLKFHTC